MTEVTLETLRAELAPVQADLKKALSFVDGIPLIHRSLTVLRQETRALKAALNEIAAVQVTSGEIQALHADVNRVEEEYAELARRLATVERLLAEKEANR